MPPPPLIPPPAIQRPQIRIGPFICVQCGSSDYPKKVAKGSLAGEIAVWLIFGFIGFFFFPLWIVPPLYSGSRFLSKSRVCRHCGGGIIDSDSPRGRQLAQQLYHDVLISVPRAPFVERHAWPIFIGIILLIVMGIAIIAGALAPKPKEQDPSAPLPMPASHVKSPRQAPSQEVVHQEEPPSTVPAVPEPEPPPKSRLGFSQYEWVWDDSHYYLVGFVTNLTYKNCRYLSVRFSLYSPTGDRLGTTSASIDNLQPGEVWKYRAFVTERRSNRSSAPEFSYTFE